MLLFSKISLSYPLILLSRNIPFSFLWQFSRAINGGIKNVLDIGCGDGSLMKLLAYGKDWKITGIDIYPKSLKAAKRAGVYDMLIEGDVIDVARDLISKKRGFDLVFCSNILEHLSKKRGITLLKQIEKLAAKKVVISVPNGFMDNPKEFLGNNRFQKHKSGWEKKEFTLLGYRVYGTGLKFVWSENGLGRSRIFFVSVLSRFFSLILSPVMYFFPEFASGLMAIKTYEKKSQLTSRLGEIVC